MNFFYWVDHTLKQEMHTGVHRVVVETAKKLVEKVNFVLVKWSPETLEPVFLTENEIKYILGPQLYKKAIKTANFTDKDWIIIPEVTHITHQPEDPIFKIISFAKRTGPKVATIFYDDIPNKLSAYSFMADNHKRYIEGISLSDIVFPISKYSGERLKLNLKNKGYNTLIKPAPLPNNYLVKKSRPNAYKNNPNLNFKFTKFILCVGSIEPRKQQLKLIDIFNNLEIKNKSEIGLVIVGNPIPQYAELLQLACSKNKNIIHLGFIDDLSLSWLYENCEFTVFPSHEEGFGLPICESLSYGKPVICANFGSMVEIAENGGCLKVNTKSQKEISEAIEKILSNELLSSTLKKQIKYRNKTNWDHYSDKIISEINQLEKKELQKKELFFLMPQTFNLDKKEIIYLISLLKSLILAKINLYITNWDEKVQQFTGITIKDFKLLNNKNGINIGLNTINPLKFPENSSILFIPDLSLYKSENFLNGIFSYCKNKKIKTVFFYKSTENKTHLNNTKNTEEIINANLIITNSEKAKHELLKTVFNHKRNLINIWKNIQNLNKDFDFSGSTKNILKSFSENICNIINNHENITTKPVYRKALTNTKENLAKSLPILSICISTYNRSKWIKYNLKHLVEQTKNFTDVVEIVVCDNCSTDDSFEVIQEFSSYENIRLYRNPQNVGMLGNLPITTSYAKGSYVWLIGDDDIVIDGMIPVLLNKIITYPNTDLIYLNYSYTVLPPPESNVPYADYAKNAHDITPKSPDYYGKIQNFSGNTENFYTAIYATIYRRDHALKTYFTKTHGEPFLSINACVPTTVYTLNNLMDGEGLWLGTPMVIVNMNVSWPQFAAICLLERFPEVYDLADARGISSKLNDKWRRKNAQGGIDWLLKKEFYYDEKFSIQRNGISFDRILFRLCHFKDCLLQIKENIDFLDKMYYDKKLISSVKPSILLKIFF